MDNAVKYCDPEGMIRVSLRGGKHPTILVDNSYMAIGSVEFDRLFDRFYTVESSRQSTGLGLSIAKELAQRMDGSIGSNFQNGTLTVWVEFPAR